jgi:hypothetical protein
MAVYPGILPGGETSSVNGLLVKGLRESEVVSDLPLLPPFGQGEVTLAWVL